MFKDFCFAVCGIVAVICFAFSIDRMATYSTETSVNNKKFSNSELEKIYFPVFSDIDLQDSNGFEYIITTHGYDFGNFHYITPDPGKERIELFNKNNIKFIFLSTKPKDKTTNQTNIAVSTGLMSKSNIDNNDYPIRYKVLVKRN